MARDELVINAETEDRILGGRLLIRQPATGYRVNVDTILLASMLPAEGTADGARIIEVGCGVGAAALIVAHKHAETRPNTRVFGLERDVAAAALARKNVALNGMTGRLEIIEADALDPPAELGTFDEVFFNPPYDYPGEGRLPAEERRAAHVAERPVGDWIKVWSNRMTGRARMTLIQRPQRLTEILNALEGRLGAVHIYPVRPWSRKPARRIIVTAQKGSQAPLELHRGIDLHPGDGSKDKYTPEIEALLRGEPFYWRG